MFVLRRQKYFILFGSYWLMIFVKLIKNLCMVMHNDPTMLSTLDKPRSKLHRPHDDRASSNRHCGSTIINALLCFFNSLAHPLLFRTEVEKGYPKVLNDSFYGTVALAFFISVLKRGGGGS